MLEIYDTYRLEKNIILNSKKTICITFGSTIIEGLLMKHKDTESVRFTKMDMNKLHVRALSTGVTSLELCFDKAYLLNYFV